MIDFDGEFEGGVCIGEINTPSDCKRYGEMLAPCYERAGWKWTMPLVGKEVPDASEIAEAIKSLYQHARRDRTWVLSGGIGIACHTEACRLYVARKLAPPVEVRA